MFRVKSAVATVLALIPLGHCYLTSPVWAMILTVVCPLILGAMLRRYLEENQYMDECVDADWHFDQP